MRSARIRTAWKNRRREVPVEEHAAAAAAAAWRIALNAAKNLHAQDFVYADDAQRLGVIREYLYFFIHAADRCMHEKFDDAQRARFITELSHACRRHYLENERDILPQKPPVAKQPARRFIDELNQRMNGYAATRFIGEQPGYQAYRALGLAVQEQLGYGQTNKWAQDQVLEIDGPEAYRIFHKALTALNESAAGRG